jgi:hypothetical protein
MITIVIAWFVAMEIRDAIAYVMRERQLNRKATELRNLLKAEANSRTPGKYPEVLP